MTAPTPGDASSGLMGVVDGTFKAMTLMSTPMTPSGAPMSNHPDEDPRIELIAPLMANYHNYRMPTKYASPATVAGRRKMARHALAILDDLAASHSVDQQVTS